MAVMLKKVFDSPVSHLVLIFLLGLLAYSNAFDVPFQFDDVPAVLENSRVKEISNIPSFFTGLNGVFASRPLLQATLGLNYYFGGLDTTGYHAVNIATHIINGVLLYLLVLMTGRNLGHAEKDVRPVALLSSLLFIAHPVQTQAVTYIASRSMLFATTFYLLGMVLFLKAATSERKRGLYVTGLFAVSLLGMGSREDFATFPLMLFIYDMFLISRFRLKEAARHYKAYLPALLSLGYFAYLLINNTYDRSADFPVSSIPRLDYALTQFRVHWTYLRLLALPVGQNLDYDYPLSESIFEFPALLSLAGYIGLCGFGIAFARRRPVAAFSIVWFLIALLPVSFGVTFMKGLKLDDVIFEHRLYLPGAALFPVAAAGILYAGEIMGTKKRRALMVPLTAILVLVLASVVFIRNDVWRSNVSLWEDVVAKSPGKARGYNNLGSAYGGKGLIDREIEYYTLALRLKPDYVDAHNNLGSAYADKGRLDEAIGQFLYALALKPDFAKAHNNLGHAYNKKGLIDEAITHYQAALRLKPDYAMAHANLGTAYYSKGLTDKAIEEYRAALKLNPNSAMAHYNIGTAYGSKGLTDVAIEHYLKALELEPDYANVHYNLGAIYFREGLMDKAYAEFEAALRLNPDDADARGFLGQINNTRSTEH